MPFTNEKTEELIQLYEQCPILYDTKNKDYKDRDRRADAFKEIARKLEETETDVRDKVRKLRNQYCREKNSKPASGSGAVRKKKWVYFDALDFLKDSVTKKNSNSNIVIEDDEEDIDTSREDDSLDHSREDVVPADSEVEVVDSLANPVSSNCDQKKRKRSTKEQSQRLQLEDTFLNSAAKYLKNKETRQHRDGIDSFVEYVGEELRGLEPRQRRICKHQIENILFQASMNGTSATSRLEDTSIHSQFDETAMNNNWNNYSKNQASMNGTSATSRREDTPITSMHSQFDDTTINSNWNNYNYNYNTTAETSFPMGSIMSSLYAPLSDNQ